MKDLKTPPDDCLPSGTRDFCYGGMYVDGKELPWLDRVHWGGKNWDRVQEDGHGVREAAGVSRWNHAILRSEPRVDNVQQASSVPLTVLLVVEKRKLMEFVEKESLPDTPNPMSLPCPFPEWNLPAAGVWRRR